VLAPRIESLKQFARVEGSLTEEEADQAYRASVTMPAFRPAVHAVQVALDGRIWMAWASPPGQRETWWVLDAEGRQVATFTAPRGMDVRAAGPGFVWVDETAEGVSWLVRYRVSELQP
jgi:hypothetical protein